MRGRLGRRLGSCVLAAAVLGGPAMSLVEPATAHAVSRPAVDDTFALEQQYLELINASRASGGLPPLVRNPILDAAADDWTAYMVAGKCPPEHYPLCHHSRTDLGALAKQASAPNGYRWWGENVQYTFKGVQGGHDSFMKSAGHRFNIMYPTANIVGIGVAFKGSAMYVTQEFVEAKIPFVYNACGRVSSTLVLGSRGTSVKVLQCALIAEAVFAGPIDGKFAKTTKAAVVAYQAAHSLKQTGKADLATRRALKLTK